KQQRLSKSQAPNLKFKSSDSAGSVGTWALGFPWNLVFGIWDFANPKSRLAPMNPLLLAARRGICAIRTNVCSLPGRDRGWVGSYVGERARSLAAPCWSP